MKNKRHPLLAIFEKYRYFGLSLSWFFASFLLLTFLAPALGWRMSSLIAAFATIASFLLVDFSFPSGDDGY